MRVGTIAAFAAIMSGALWTQYASAQDALPPPPPPPGAPVAPPPGAATAPPPAVVGTNVNLRQGPGTNYTVITLIPAGTPVNVSGCNGGWCQVSFSGQNGYIIATAIAPPGGGPGGPPPSMAEAPIPVAPGAPPPGYYPPPPPPYYYGYGPYYGPAYGPYWRRGYYGYRRW
jgi:hypothetical protein